MLEKDYYRILNISPSASTEEIKKAYRKLALIHHPDKSNGSTVSLERFAEIQEAYTILSDKKKRSDYHYKRYYENISQKPLSETAEEVLTNTAKLKTRIERLDPFRIDKDQVYFELRELLDLHNIRLIQASANESISFSFTTLFLECLIPLDFERTKELCHSLYTVTNTDPLSQKLIKEYLKKNYLLHLWNTYKIFFALLISTILCISIFLLVRMK